MPSGTQIWLKQTGQSAALLQATAKATVPQNNVYLYDGTNGVPDAQRLILAQDATLTTTVNAKALFTQTGSLIVQKTITGPAAGKQGAVTINVRCGGVLVGDPFDIPAGSTGTMSKTYDNIPVGTSCTVTEIHDGQTSTVTVEVDGSGQTGHRRRRDHDRHDHRHVQLRDAGRSGREEVDHGSRRRASRARS